MILISFVRDRLEAISCFALHSELLMLEFNFASVTLSEPTALLPSHSKQ